MTLNICTEELIYAIPNIKITLIITEDSPEQLQLSTEFNWSRKN